MHESSLACMRHFVETHLSERRAESISILDMGSADVNGTYRPLFDVPNWNYVGCDIGDGPNVDLVLQDPYEALPFSEDSFDVIISGQVLEHVAFPWVVLGEWERVLKVGGLLCVIVPSTGPEHSYPIDCYRYLPEGLAAMLHWVGLEVIELAQSSAEGWLDNSDEWLDIMAIGRKVSGRSSTKIRSDRERVQALPLLDVSMPRTIVVSDREPLPNGAPRPRSWSEAVESRIVVDDDARQVSRREWLSHPVVEQWADRHGGGPFLDWAFQSIRDVGGILVSIGCGSAQAEVALLAEGVIDSLLLIDLADGNLDAARAVAERAGVSEKVTFFVDPVDASSIGSIVADADVILASDSFHRINDLEAIVQAIHDGLRPGGVLIGRGYAGPNRFAFEPEVQALAERAYRGLPANLRCPWPNLPRPDPEAVAAADPTEAVASSRIRAALTTSFSNCEIIEIGGAIAYPVWYGVDHDAVFENPGASREIEKLVSLDEQLTEAGTVPSYFMRFRCVR